VDWDRLGCPEPGGFAHRKDALTRRLLALRRDRPGLFAAGTLRVEEEDGAWRLVREAEEGQVVLSLAWTAAPGGAVSLDWLPSEGVQAAE
jgi:hypothetical protein